MTAITDLPGTIRPADLLDFDPVEVVRQADLRPGLGTRLAALPVKLILLPIRMILAVLRGILTVLRALLRPRVLLLLIVAFVVFLFTPGPGTELRQKLMAAVGGGGADAEADLN